MPRARWRRRRRSFASVVSAHQLDRQGGHGQRQERHPRGPVVIEGHRCVARGQQRGEHGTRSGAHGAPSNHHPDPEPPRDTIDREPLHQRRGRNHRAGAASRRTDRGRQDGAASRAADAVRTIIELGVRRVEDHDIRHGSGRVPLASSTTGAVDLAWRAPSMPQPGSRRVCHSRASRPRPSADVAGRRGCDWPSKPVAVLRSSLYDIHMRRRPRSARPRCGPDRSLRPRGYPRPSRDDGSSATSCRQTSRRRAPTRCLATSGGSSIRS